MDLLAQYQSGDEEEDAAAPLDAADQPAKVAAPSSIAPSERSKRKKSSSTSDKKQSKSSKRAKREKDVEQKQQLESLSVGPSSQSPPPAASSSHDGRVRSFEHVEGNWATHIFVPLKLTNAEEFHRATQVELDRLAEEATPWHRFTQSPSDSVAPISASSCLHISLSRTVVLRTETIKPFVVELQSAITEVLKRTPSRAGDASLRLNFRGVKEYHNDERTRRFAAMMVQMNADGDSAGDTIDASNAASSSIASAPALLLRLIQSIDRVLCSWGQPMYYDPPELHASFAWRLASAAAASTPEQDAAATANSSAELRCTASIDRVLCTVGKKLHTFSLIS
jgi:hypothetical protein